MTKRECEPGEVVVRPAVAQVVIALMPLFALYVFIIAINVFNSGGSTESDRDRFLTLVTFPVLLVMFGVGVWVTLRRAKVVLRTDRLRVGRRSFPWASVVGIDEVSRFGSRRVVVRHRYQPVEGRPPMFLTTLLEWPRSNRWIPDRGLRDEEGHDRGGVGDGSGRRLATCSGDDAEHRDRLSCSRRNRC